MDEVQAVLERELAAAKDRLAAVERSIAADRERVKRLQRMLAEWAKNAAPEPGPASAAGPGVAPAPVGPPAERVLRFEREEYRGLSMAKILVKLAEDNDGYLAVTEAATAVMQLGYYETPQQAGVAVAQRLAQLPCFERMKRGVYALRQQQEAAA